MMAYYRNLGLDTAQGFNDYMERTIGEINTLLPSLIMLQTLPTVQS